MVMPRLDLDRIVSLPRGDGRFLARSRCYLTGTRCCRPRGVCCCAVNDLSSGDVAAFDPLPRTHGVVIMPDVDVDDLIDDCRREVDDGGFTVVALVGDELGCDWAYTIGLHRNFGHPELLVVGLEAKLGGIVLELLGRRIAEGQRVDLDRPVVLDGGLEFRPCAVDPLFLSMGDWFVLGREVMHHWGQRWPESIQLVWTDAEDHDGAAPHATPRQPLLFTV
jgi:hypothetical protein